MVDGRSAEVVLVAADTGSPGLAYTARGENLLDASYEEVFEFTALEHGLYLAGRIHLVAG